jgi:hypothetical protein
LKNVVADFLSRPNQTTSESVATTLAADPVDFEEMAAEQNCCPETQRLLGGTSLKLAFHQTGAQCLAGDVSTGNFCPIIILNFRKTILTIFTMSLTPGGLPPVILLHLGLLWCGLSSDVTAWAHGCLACQRGKIQRHTRLVPQPTMSFFSHPCRFGGPFAVH